MPVISFVQLEWLGKKQQHLAPENVAFNMRSVLVSFHWSTNQRHFFKWNPRIIMWVLVNVLMANLKINMVNVFIKMNVHVHLGTGIITSYNSYLMSHQ